MNAVVHIVDDDQAVRRALLRLMQSAGLIAEAHESAEHFLAAADLGRACCVVLDLRMPGEGGLALQQRLAQHCPAPPVIIITGHGDVPAAVQAIRTGAIDFLQKPYEPRVLLERVQQALALAERKHEEAARQAARTAALNRLSPREREVFDRLVLGQSSKQIAAVLNLSRKTVDIHRAHVMIKLGVESVAELVHLSVAESDGRRDRPAPDTAPPDRAFP